MLLKSEIAKVIFLTPEYARESAIASFSFFLFRWRQSVRSTRGGLGGLGGFGGGGGFSGCVVLGGGVIRGLGGSLLQRGYGGVGSFFFFGRCGGCGGGGFWGGFGGVGGEG